MDRAEIIIHSNGYIRTVMFQHTAVLYDSSAEKSNINRDQRRRH